MSPEYGIWSAMLRRCRNPNVKDYPRYGGRGIAVCQEWIGPTGFRQFIADIGLRPTPQHQIDRIDTNGNYEPSNCRWVTSKQNNRNRRNNHLITINGETKSLAELAEVYNIPARRLWKRINYGWSVDKALTTPPNSDHLSAERRADIRQRRRDGKSISQIARETNAGETTVGRICRDITGIICKRGPQPKGGI